MPMQTVSLSWWGPLPKPSRTLSLACAWNYHATVCMAKAIGWRFAYQGGYWVVVRLSGHVWPAWKMTFNYLTFGMQHQGHVFIYQHGIWELRIFYMDKSWPMYEKAILPWCIMIRYYPTNFPSHYFWALATVLTGMGQRCSRPAALSSAYREI